MLAIPAVEDAQLASPRPQHQPVVILGDQQPRDGAERHHPQTSQGRRVDLGSERLRRGHDGHDRGEPQHHARPQEHQQRNHPGRAVDGLHAQHLPERPGAAPRHEPLGRDEHPICLEQRVLRRRECHRAREGLAHGVPRVPESPESTMRRKSSIGWPSAKQPWAPSRSACCITRSSSKGTRMKTGAVPVVSRAQCKASRMLSPRCTITNAAPAPWAHAASVSTAMPTSPRTSDRSETSEPSAPSTSTRAVWEQSSFSPLGAAAQGSARIHPRLGHREVELAAAVAGPDLLPTPQDRRALLSVGHHRDVARPHAELHQVVLGHRGPPLPERQVVLRRAQLTGVSGDRHPRPGPPPQRLGEPLERLPRLGPQRGGVELIIDGSERQGRPVGVLVRNRGLLRHRGGRRPGGRGARKALVGDGGRGLRGTCTRAERDQDPGKQGRTHAFSLKQPPCLPCFPRKAPPGRGRSEVSRQPSVADCHFPSPGRDGGWSKRRCRAAPPPASCCLHSGPPPR
ncbi:hypothetical protein STIAU_0017 [Stigmatella aurantiaca DW4/3-1]|uniref:Uncharacterized protein n=1 Tax=Stigmatella aurantiaca (strain DW4/3-1) TaxID=378806 RepID=Q08Q11_STIAD|nr:hypothetical protein STIAU_0017 [Stigmatella aurantiaca DW4/3-1]